MYTISNLLILALYPTAVVVFICEICQLIRGKRWSVRYALGVPLMTYYVMFVIMLYQGMVTIKMQEDLNVYRKMIWDRGDGRH